MKWRPAAIGCVLVAIAAHDAQSQSIVRVVGDDVKNAALDFAAIWTSPLRGTGKDYLITAGILGAAAAISPLDDEADRWAIRNEDKGFLKQIAPFRRGGALYSINKAAPYVAGLYVIGVATRHDGIRDGIFGCLASYGANTTIRHQVVYRLVGRDRPEVNRNTTEDGVTPPAQHGDQYDFDIPADGWGQHSFPGGHIATMTTCASFLSHRFEMGLVEPVLAGLVGIMGVGRIADRGHWVSDQVVGAAFGFAIGREVAHRQLKRRAAEKAKAAGAAEPLPPDGATGAPFMDTGANGTRFGWQVTF